MPFQNDILTGASAGGKTGYALWGWGQGQQGHLGSGETTSNNLDPVQIGTETYWLGRDPEDDKSVKLVVGSSFAITNDNELFAWGNAEAGRLGDGETIHKSSPVQIGSLTDWDNVAALGQAATAIKTDGTLWTWGDGQGGTLGDGETIDKSSPVQVGTLTNWDRVYGSGLSAMAVKTDGTLWVWGYNQYGELGTGNQIAYSSPVQIGTLTNWASGAFGGEMGAAIKTDGTLWTWGRNAGGQLGHNNKTDRSSPVQVGTLTNWAQVSCWPGFNAPSLGGWMAVKTDGTLWGNGTSTDHTGGNMGNLGSGNNIAKSSPVQIGSLTDWQNVACQAYSTYAVKTDGTMWFWGRGYHGTGDGDRTDRSSPNQVGTATDWKQIGQAGNNNYTVFGLRD